MTKKSTWAQRGKTLEQRFWEKVNKTDRCWLWTSAIGSRGYGIFWLGGGVSDGAHQVSYRMHKGEIPHGLMVMHSCDNPACVNPDHLSVGTARDNALDAKSKGRLAIGERNGGGRKLTTQAVADIKGYSVLKLASIAELAEKFGVSRYAIKRIRCGRGWTHVEPNLSVDKKNANSSRAP